MPLTMNQKTKRNFSKLPVRSLDSSSFKPVPSEYEPKRALVYLRTRPGPQGPKPLHIQDQVIKFLLQLSIQIFLVTCIGAYAKQINK